MIRLVRSSRNDDAQRFTALRTYIYTKANLPLIAIASRRELRGIVTQLMWPIKSAVTFVGARIEVIIGLSLSSLVFLYVCFRSTQGVSLLLHLHDIHERSMGRREDPGGVRERISRPSGRGVREMYSRRHPDGQLPESGR